MSVSGNVLVFRTALAAAGLHSQHASAVLRLLSGLGLYAYQVSWFC